MIMEKVASGTFKKDFGRVLQDAHRKTVTITRHGRDYVTLLPSEDFEAIQSEVLGEYFLEKVKNGELSFLEAIREERRILDDVRQAEIDYENGKYVELEDAKKAFYDKAVKGLEHYQETGLHVTQDDLIQWAKSLSETNPLPFPQCHK